MKYIMNEEKKITRYSFIITQIPPVLVQPFISERRRPFAIFWSCHIICENAQQRALVVSYLFTCNLQAQYIYIACIAPERRCSGKIALSAKYLYSTPYVKRTFLRCGFQLLAHPLFLNIFKHLTQILAVNNEMVCRLSFKDSQRNRMGDGLESSGSGQRPV